MYACELTVSINTLIEAVSIVRDYAYLGSLDVVMEIIAERLDVRDDVGHPLGSEMPGEQH